MFKQNEKAIAQIADYIPRACRGMQLQEAKARLEKKIALYIDDGCDAAVLNAACNQVNHLIPTRVLVKGGEITCKILK
ncbi:hypothetical protein ACX6WR_004276 [Escherichia coli]